MEASPYRQFRGDRHQEEGHFARQCTKPKTPKNSARFKEKMLLAEALESKAYLDPKELDFLADNEDTVIPAQSSQEILTIAAFQTVKSHKTLSTTVECLKKESKQKEDKYLDEVIDLQKKNKSLDNVVNKMGQSTQTMHMLTKPQAFYDESHKTTLGYQNPFYLSRAQRKVPTLYDGHAIFKSHDALFVTDTEETLELAEGKLLKHKNNRLMELLISQDLVHTAVISLVAINDYKTMQQSFMDEYNETLVLKAKLAKNNDMIEKAVPMRLESINEKKYILVIVDDYSRFTWVKFLRSKDESPEDIIKCMKQIQVRMNASVRNIRTDNATEFVNQTIKDYYENVRISHQTSVACTLQ
nr:integrase, catalytic region, zinc finger, CCHC-type, peptidase aspartic, catalytic [Tanacetum cinerariifolium]